MAKFTVDYYFFYIFVYYKEKWPRKRKVQKKKNKNTKITYIQHLLESMKQKPMALFSSNVSDTTESFIF